MGKKVKKKQRIKKRAGKKKKAKSRPYHVWKLYKVEDGKVVRLRKTCPICGPSVYLAEHKDRWTCGRCGYTEWKKEKAKAVA
ncbi:MAG: 30S ribosomal protein S27ae [Candidatus Njordarchaeia archaeon]